MSSLTPAKYSRVKMREKKKISEFPRADVTDRANLAVGQALKKKK